MAVRLFHLRTSLQTAVSVGRQCGAAGCPVHRRSCLLAVRWHEARGRMYSAVQCYSPFQDQPHCPSPAPCSPVRGCTQHAPPASCNPKCACSTLGVVHRPRGLRFRHHTSCRSVPFPARSSGSSSYWSRAAGGGLAWRSLDPLLVASAGSAASCYSSLISSAH